MTSRGVSRDRFRRDHTGRPEEKSRGKAPPSRHLWIGNLSHNISERTLAEHFLNFGELESVAFQPGRSYAFINFKRREEAIAALRELQGFPVAGMPLRVEFAKADKPSTPPRDEVFSQRHDEEHSPRDSRPRHASPGPFYPSKSRTSEKNEESPSEVLWVGFPALLKVDEMILKKAFSPFGEIEKITAFPGRSYAFVRFRSVIAAWRAKETLQGKLFGNPRVHICFAKSETGVSNTGKNSINALPSTHMKSNSRPVFSENIREDRNFGSFVGDSSVRSPDFLPQFDAGESEFTKFSRKRSSWRDEHDTYDRKAFPELSCEIRASTDVYGRHSSPINDRSQFRDFSPRKFPRKSPALKELWDLPEDSTLFYGAKKLKTGPFRPEKELPEYPFSDHEQEKQPLPRVFSDFPPHAAPDRTFDHGSFGYKQSSDQPKSITLSHRERGDKWIESHDSPQVHSGYFNRAPPKRLTPEPKQPSLSEWKWEGTIAKGGTPVCRARCFPVGKIRDISLPECLDCTARTGLDMLAKHYYQAANAWVVFFVPETDADIGLYNEFMNYLGEKQRAAVAKLDDKNTLFLVPPSDFSEKVLKVPGKLSISGVILRLEHPGSDAAVERRDFMSFPRREASSPSGPASPVLARFSGLGKSAVENEPFPEHVSRFPHASFSGSSHTPESYNNQTRHDFVPKQWNPELGHSQINTHRSQSSVSGSRNMAPQSAPQSFNPNSAQEMRSDPFASLQPEQLAQLASSLLGQQRQLQSTNNQPEDSFRVSERFVPQHNPTPPELLTSQFGQEVQQQQNTNQREVVAGVQGDHVMQNTTSAQEEAEPDPQKRLQATLQLAAALLQQIQQGKGT